MERNRFETALRCLELALHPNAADAEVIAAVNGFRRTASGTPLRQICAALRLGGEAAPPADAERLARLLGENRELRRRLDLQQSAQTAAIRRWQDAERQVRALRAELLAAEQRAAVAEQRLDDLRAAAGRRAPPPFEQWLAAARQRAGHAEPRHAPAAAGQPGAWTA